MFHLHVTKMTWPVADATGSLIVTATERFKAGLTEFFGACVSNG